MAQIKSSEAGHAVIEISFYKSGGEIEIHFRFMVDLIHEIDLWSNFGLSLLALIIRRLLSPLCSVSVGI